MLAPGGPAALAGPFNQAQLEFGNNLLVYTAPPLTEPLHIFGSPQAHALLRHLRCPRRLHRQTGEAASQRSGRLCMHRHRALFVSFSRVRLHADAIHCWQIDARAHLLCLCRRRCDSPGSGQQRLPLVRPQSIHCQCSRGLPIRGTGSAPPRWCCMMRSIPPGWNCHVAATS